MRSRSVVAVGLGLVAVLGSSACTRTEQATEVIVIVRADDAVTRACNRLTVSVRGFASGSDVPTTMIDNELSPPMFPRRIAIVPAADDVTRTFSIEVHAMASAVGGAAVLLSTARARTGFLAHRTTEVSLLLVAGCSCPPRQTCNAAGRCVDEMVMVGPDGGPQFDSGPTPDAGSDAALPVICTGTSACDDGDSCTDPDACLGGVCRGTPVRCDDGDVCNGTETCAAGGCQPGALLLCDDGVPCTEDSCDPSSGCRHAAMDSLCTMSAGGRCDAVLGCSYPMGCSTGGCPPDPCMTATCNGDVCSYTPICNDDNPCTTDTCTGGACNYTTVSGSCVDGNPCTTADRCVGRNCIGTTILCESFGPCRIDSCNIKDGMCAPIYVSDGAHCTIFDNLCVTSSECRSGVCQATTIATMCPDSTPCDPAVGCL